MTTLERYASIETPEQVAIDVELAAPGSRFVAYAIDTLWQSLVLILCLVVALSLATLGDQKATSKDATHLFLTPLGFAVVNLVFFAVNFGYFTFFELLWRGQTPGKKLVGLRVIRAGGYPLTFTASFLRNLLRVVDFLPAGYAVGVLAASLGDRWQRLGDLAAGTWVVRELPQGQPARSTGVPDTDAQLATDYWARHQELDIRKGEAVARELATAIAQRRGEALPADPVVYLGAVARGG